MVIVGKSLGQKKKLFEDWSIPIPPEFRDDNGVTLRQLIESVVRAEVTAFKERQLDRQFVHVLTSKQIEAGAVKGKIQSGGSDVPLQEVDAESAVGTALQAFEDGLYLVVIDGIEQTELDQQVFVQDESQIVFIRLTLLAGG